MKLVKDAFNKKNDSDEDSESDNDLLDGKMINEIKNGLRLDSLWSKRKITIEKPTVNPEEFKEKFSAPRKRRFTL